MNKGKGSGAAASRWLDPPINTLRQIFFGCLGSLAHIIKIKIPLSECHIVSEIRNAAGVQMRPLRWFPLVVPIEARVQLPMSG